MNKDIYTVSRIMPCSVVLLSVATQTKRDAMTATAMFVSEDPPLFVVSVAKHILTHLLIEESGQFIINVASHNQVQLAKKLGSTHGMDVDKFKKFNIAVEKWHTMIAPKIKGAFAHIACKVITSFSIGKYVLYLVEAVDYSINRSVKPLVWNFNRYYSIGDEIR